MLIGLIKTALFIFPFVKELFLGKDASEQTKDSIFTGFMKRLTIGLGVISVVLNIYFIDRLFTLASQQLALNRELHALKEARTQKTHQEQPATQPFTPATVKQIPTTSDLPHSVSKKPAAALSEVDRTTWNSELSKMAEIDAVR